uniref:uncharacterized protein K02A2.6-like n=1 Tax=Podarcis muralis TaxID=64176 RepID=UPI0010A03A6A
GCLLWGDRVVIPQRLRQRVLEALHVGHPGIVKMKALARCYVWWPNMDDAITAWVSACQACQESRPAPPAAKEHTWETPKTPWSRLHIDLAGPFHGRTFMVVVDAYSKWPEVALMSSTTTEAVIRVLRGLFATHGCPDVLVSNNGPQFTSGTFEWYLLGAEYLFVQHITPHAATGQSPAELLMGHLRSPLDRLHPDFAVAEPPGCANAPQSFVPGNQVFARNYVGDIPWVPATVVGVTGPCSYQVALEDGHLWHWHIDQLRRRVGDLDTTVVPPTALVAPEETLTDGEAPPLSQTASMEPNEVTSEGPTCNFSELENMLHDHLVGGLKDEKLQRRHYAKKDLTFQVALEEALATEAAERLTQEARQSLPPQPRVHHEDLANNSGSDREDVHQVQRRTQAAHRPQLPQREGGNYASCGESQERRTCCFHNASDDRSKSPRSQGPTYQGNSTEITDCQVYQLPHPNIEKIHAELDPTVRPVRLKARWVPFTLKLYAIEVVKKFLFAVTIATW